MIATALFGAESVGIWRRRAGMLLDFRQTTARGQEICMDEPAEIHENQGRYLITGGF